MSKFHPVSRGAFVGRDDASEAILEMLRERGAVVTILGPPGIGKTRLALRLASSVSDGALEGRSEVHVIDCTDTRAPSELVRLVAEAVEISLPRGTTLDEAARIVGSYIEARRALFVFDNLEQTARATRSLLDRWIRRSRRPRFLCTSRVRLELEREEVYQLTPLRGAEAVELYVDRARLPDADSERIDPEDVEALVERLGANPFVVELAAAQARHLPPRRLLDRVESASGSVSEADAEGRLRASIERSWRRLEPPERLVLGQLTAFARGATLDVLEEIVDLGRFDANWSLPSLLERLAEQSLVRRQRTRSPARDRYVPYVPVAAFVEERNEAVRTDASVESRHAAYYTRLARDIVETYQTEPAELETDRIRPEIENLLRAFDWSLSHRPRDAVTIARGLRCFDLLFPTGLDRGSLFERLDDVLGDAEDSLPPGLEVRLSFLRCEHRTAEGGEVSDELIEAFEDISRRAWKHDAMRTFVEARSSLGWLLVMKGSMEEALGVFEDSLETVRDRGLDRYEPSTLEVMALASARLGEPERARELFREAEESLDPSLNPQIAGNLYTNWADFELARGRIGEASAALERASRAFGELERPSRLAYTRGNKAIVSLVEGRHDAALDLIRDAVETVRALGRHGRLPEFLVIEAVVRLALGDHGRAEEALHDAESASRSDGAAPVRPLVHVWQAILAARRRRVAESKALHRRSRETPSTSESLREVARAERLLSEAAGELDRGRLREACAHLTQAARLAGAPMSERERDTYTMVARRLFEDRRERLQEELLDRLEEGDEPWIAVEASESRWARLSDGTELDVRSRSTPRRILHALVEEWSDDQAEPSRLSVETLLEVGWPGADSESTDRSRVYTTVSRMRDEGLEDVLCKDAEGYFLDPDWIVLPTRRSASVPGAD